MVKLTERTRSGDPRCPFCHDDVDSRSRAWSCPRCGTYHHDGCAVEHGKCAVHGCGGTHGEAVVIERTLPAAPRRSFGLIEGYFVVSTIFFLIRVVLELLGRAI
jgi:hypothetical protein